MVKRRFLYIAIFILCFMVVSTTGAFAMGKTGLTTEQNFSVLNAYINQVKTTLSISANGIATVYSFVQKSTNGEEIYLSSTLQRNSNGYWSNVENWFVCTNSSSATISEEYLVTHGEYRVETNYYVSGYDGGYDCGTVYSAVIDY